MTNLNPPGKSVSLDDLLRASKEQFDKVFAVRKEEIAVAGEPTPAPTDFSSTDATKPAAPTQVSLL